MSILDAIVLGLVQGLTEFIPVSSSGHLILVDKLTPINGSFAFDVLVNIGTLAALILYFRSKLVEIFKQIFYHQDYHLARNIVISTIPAVIAGGLLANLFASDNIRNIKVVIGALLIVGLLMLVIDKLVKLKSSINKMSTISAGGIGIAQALALIPGTSRSGITMLAGRMFGLSYKQSAEYSFLIAMPILFGAILRSLFESDTTLFIQNNIGSVITGVLVAFISGYLAIRFMIKFLQTRGLKLFGFYRIILAVTLLLFVS